MSKQPTTGHPAHEQNKTDRPKSAVVLLLSDVVSTTWRMFVPVFGLTALGIYLDIRYSLTPWLMVVGIVLGTTLAILLVRQQLRKVIE